MPVLPQKRYSRIVDVIELPKLIEVQLQAFRAFQETGLRELFEEVSPIVSFNKNLELHFLDYRFEEAKYDEEACRDRDITYASPLWVKVRLINKETGEISEQEVFMGDFPLMTRNGTFVINGAERVVVSQLIRSPGAYFSVADDRSTGRSLAMAKLIPNRGAWLEFETSKRDIVSVKVDRKRKLPASILLRALGYGTDEEIYDLFKDVDDNPDHPYIASTIERDSTKTEKEALLEFYKKLRPGDPPTMDNATSFIEGLLFSPRRYDLGKVGRYKLNRRLGYDVGTLERVLTKQDLVEVIKRLININNGKIDPDDIDHLGNRRVKTVGELIQNQLRVGLLRMERVVKERMSIKAPDQITPMSLVNIRPLVAATREFFGGSQLSQFMQQTNPLDELTHKRTLSALGPGGLRRERAGFDVRDVHHSHYGRICPIETPEGPNIGLIGRLASFARVNDYGFVETPYRKVIKSVDSQNVELLVGKTLRDDVLSADGKVLAEEGDIINEDLAIKVADAKLDTSIAIVPSVLNEIVYLSADEEELYTVAQANTELDGRNQFVNNQVEARHGADTGFQPITNIDYIDVSPKQIVGISAALIPFLEHDDANRALMGSNMQRQAVPLIRPNAPTVGTGMESSAAFDSGQLAISPIDGEVVSVTGRGIQIKADDDGRIVNITLRKFARTNQSTCIDQRPIVSKGDKVREGQVLADSSSTEDGELALGQNILVAFLSWEGGNYEDAILISEELVRDDKFTSIHVEKHEMEARDTKLGPEEFTRDIPNVGEEALKDLDERGVIRVGANVGPNDILAGKITPKGETELTPEEKLLRAIFGEKAREVKDSSLKLPHGDQGIVVDVSEFSREEHRDLSAGVDKMVRIMVAQKRKLREGDKMAGRHGNKGVISKVVPIEDMPYLEDGTSVQIILNPLGVPARMNIGQILETHLGWAVNRLGFRAVTPVFDGAHEDEIQAELARAWLIDYAWNQITEEAWQWLQEQDYEEEDIEDENEVRQLYLIEVLDPAEIDEERLATNLTYARRRALHYWLQKRGYDSSFLLAFEGERRDETVGTQAREAVRLVCLREWLKHLKLRQEVDTTFRHAEELTDLDVDKLSDDELDLIAIRVSRQTNSPIPTTGKLTLYNGKTGEPYDKPVTIGIIHMLKLAHLVEDKVHARSTGPYSLVTQQPLGGKAQFGGQRFGEMEVWALEAYGAAHTLQEMLTVKSDDVSGRVKTYEAIVRGELIQDPGVPESFRVLVKELQSLGLSVQVLGENEDRITFGKEEQKERLPKLGLGLGIPGGAR